ncbi:MAG: hypothetical protein PHY88_03045 [Candidatus Omnitrophica bacterium]|nr:hypothetical protein [Candidatus Omnitrophota bacterium]
MKALSQNTHFTLDSCRVYCILLLAFTHSKDVGLKTPKERFGVFIFSAWRKIVNILLRGP